MKPTDKQRKEVTKIVEKWRRRLFLHEWFVDVSYAKEDIRCDGPGEVVASIESDPVYKNAEITIYPAWFTRSPKRRELALVHELCHCHTQAVANNMHNMRNGTQVFDHDIRDHIEELTQRMALIAFRDEWGPK